MLATMITTENPLTVAGLSKAEEVKVSAMLQSIGTTPADFLVKLLRMMARTGVVPLLVDPNEKQEFIPQERTEAQRAVLLGLAPIESLGIPHPHECHLSHEPNKETVEFLLLPDSEKEYTTFTSFEDWFSNMQAVTK